MTTVEKKILQFLKLYKDPVFDPLGERIETDSIFFTEDAGDKKYFRINIIHDRLTNQFSIVQGPVILFTMYLMIQTSPTMFEVKNRILDLLFPFDGLKFEDVIITSYNDTSINYKNSKATEKVDLSPGVIRSEDNIMITFEDYTLEYRKSFVTIEYTELQPISIRTSKDNIFKEVLITIVPIDDKNNHITTFNTSGEIVTNGRTLEYSKNKILDIILETPRIFTHVLFVGVEHEITSQEFDRYSDIITDKERKKKLINKWFFKFLEYGGEVVLISSALVLIKFAGAAALVAAPETGGASLVAFGAAAGGVLSLIGAGLLFSQVGDDYNEFKADWATFSASILASKNTTSAVDDSDQGVYIVESKFSLQVRDGQNHIVYDAETGSTIVDNHIVYPNKFPYTNPTVVDPDISYPYTSPTIDLTKPYKKFSQRGTVNVIHPSVSGNPIQGTRSAASTPVHEKVGGKTLGAVLKPTKTIRIPSKNTILSTTDAETPPFPFTGDRLIIIMENGLNIVVNNFKEDRGQSRIVEVISFNENGSLLFITEIDERGVIIADNSDSNPIISIRQIGGVKHHVIEIDYKDQYSLEFSFYQESIGSIKILSEIRLYPLPKAPRSELTYIMFYNPANLHKDIGNFNDVVYEVVLPNPPSSNAVKSLQPVIKLGTTSNNSSHSKDTLVQIITELWDLNYKEVTSLPIPINVSIIPPNQGQGKYSSYGTTYSNNDYVVLQYFYNSNNSQLVLYVHKGSFNEGIHSFIKINNELNEVSNGGEYYNLTGLPTNKSLTVKFTKRLATTITSKHFLKLAYSDNTTIYLIYNYFPYELIEAQYHPNPDSDIYFNLLFIPAIL